MREPITKQDIRTIVGAVEIQTANENKRRIEDYAERIKGIEHTLKACSGPKLYLKTELFRDLFDSEKESDDMYNYYVLVKAMKYGYLSKGEKYYLLTEKLGL